MLTSFRELTQTAHYHGDTCKTGLLRDWDLGSRNHQLIPRKGQVLLKGWVIE